MAKSDDMAYRSIVERIQAKKGAVVAECDGYTVTLKPLPDNATPRLSATVKTATKDAK